MEGMPKETAGEFIDKQLDIREQQYQAEIAAKKLAHEATARTAKPLGADGNIGKEELLQTNRQEFLGIDPEKARAYAKELEARRYEDEEEADEEDDGEEQEE